MRKVCRVAGTSVEESRDTIDHPFLVPITKALYAEYGKMIDGAAPHSREAMRILGVQGQSMLQNPRLAPINRRCSATVLYNLFAILLGDEDLRLPFVQCGHGLKVNMLCVAL
jgi:hypothetical protein